MREYLVLITILLACAITGVVTGCQPDARTLYHQGTMQLMSGSYSEALAKFEAGLAQEPESKLLLYGKAKALVGLERYEEALPAFEQFLKATDTEQSIYSSERTDATFYRDKCKQELGQEVPQDPSAIPEEKMRY